ncbi:hypothetical protein vseg_007625 [Gypsophila vaccaria]
MCYLSFSGGPFWLGFAVGALALNFICVPLLKLVWGFYFSHLRHPCIANVSGFLKDPSHSAQINADTPTQDGAIEATLPKLQRSDYYTDPPILELAAKETAVPGYCRHVKDFLVGRRGYGFIQFLGETDVRGLHLDSVIHFTHREVIIYMDDTGKHPFGQELHKSAVTNLNIKCIDTKTGNRILSRSELYQLKLKQLADSKVANNPPLEGLRQFTYQSLVDATQNFSLDCRLSFDRLGDVFRGQSSSTNEAIAIRRLKQYPPLHLREFLDEVLLLSQANHPNLAKLIGYCAEKHNRLLVYEHLPRGTLKNHLYVLHTCFDWDMRMELALGLARALEYLQNSMMPPILHCYVDPSNIWLDEEYTPKLSAYGLVRMFPSRIYKFGSYEYAVPDYLLTKKVTIEADIYGFGIFLLEIITGKEGIFLRKDGLPQYLSDWARPYLKDKQNLVEMVDKRLEGEFDYEKLHEVCDIIEKCLEKQPNSRPRIADIVMRLNYLVA